MERRIVFPLSFFLSKGEKKRIYFKGWAKNEVEKKFEIYFNYSMETAFCVKQQGHSPSYPTKTEIEKASREENTVKPCVMDSPMLQETSELRHQIPPFGLAKKRSALNLKSLNFASSSFACDENDNFASVSTFGVQQKVPRSNFLPLLA